MATTSSFRTRRWSIALAGVLLLGIGLGSALTGLARANVATAEEPATEVQMARCRGPFTLITGAGAMVTGKKATVAAGSRGEALAPGECALETRPISAKEPRRFRFSFGTDTYGYARGMMPALAVCALDDECVMTVRVQHDTVTGNWNVVNNQSVILWKYGTTP